MAATLLFGASLNGRKEGDVDEVLYPGAYQSRSSAQSTNLFFDCVVRVFGKSPSKEVKCHEMQLYMVLSHVNVYSRYIYNRPFFFLRGGSYFNFKAPRLVLLKRMGPCGRKVGHVASNKYSKLSQQRSVSTALLR